MIYNKLVRDNIIEIMQNKGEKPIFEILDDENYKIELDKKLKEETNEYLESKKIEELADILEVIESICTSKNITLSNLFEVKNKKQLEKGGFEKKYFLISK